MTLDASTPLARAILTLGIISLLSVPVAGAQEDDGRILQSAAAQASQLDPVTARRPLGPALPAFARPPGRPAGLVPLYVSFGLLQMLDAHSTTRALENGAVETNPFLTKIAGNPTAFYATKAATSAAAIYFAEKLWKRNRAASLVMMIALNSTYGMVVRHNYAVAGVGK